MADSGLASIRVLDWTMHFVAGKIYATLLVVAAWNISLGHIPELSGIERLVSRLCHHQIINFGMASIHHCLDPRLHRDDRILWIAVRKGI